MSAEDLPLLLFFSLILLTIGGLVAVYPLREGRWARNVRLSAPWVGIALLALVWGWALADFSHSDALARSISRGWIGPRGENGAITVGLILDFGFFMGVGVALLGAVSLMSCRRQIEGVSSDLRSDGPIALSCAGGALAWASITPWLALLGAALTLFGAFSVLSSFGESEADSKLAARFGWVACWGLSVGILGCCVLSSGRGAIAWGDPGATSVTGVSLAGAVFAATGIFSMIQAFPFLGWRVQPQGAPPATRKALSLVFPSWAAFALLYRLHPLLARSELLPAMGWIALICSLLTSLSGFAQRSRQGAFPAWISSGFALATAALAFSGPATAFPLFLGTALATLAVILFDGLLSSSVVLRTGAAIAVLSATGFPGFLASRTFSLWLMEAWADPSQTAVAAAAIIAMGAFATLAWKVYWLSPPRGKQPNRGAAFAVFPALLTIVTISLLWTGTLSGGMLMGDPDRFFGSAFDHYLGEVKLTDAASFAWAVSCGLSLLGAGIGYWAFRRGTPQSKERAETALQKFLSSGFGIEVALASTLRFASAAAVFAQTLIDGKIWGDWLPRTGSAALQKVAYGAGKVDPKITSALNVTVRRTTDVPSKLFQLAQSGDIQWYLLFALGMIIAILIHFLKT